MAVKRRNTSCYLYYVIYLKLDRNQVYGVKSSCLTGCAYLLHDYVLLSLNTIVRSHAHEKYKLCLTGYDWKGISWDQRIVFFMTWFFFIFIPQTLFYPHLCPCGTCKLYSIPLHSTENATSVVYNGLRWGNVCHTFSLWMEQDGRIQSTFEYLCILWLLYTTSAQ